MTNARRLTIEELQDLVRRSIAGEAPLDTLVTAAIFGSREAAPVWWRDWPQHARDAWDKAVWLHRLATGGPTGLRRAKNAPTLESSWRAIEAMAPDPERWWEIPGVTWPKLAPVLGCRARTVHYHLCDVLGWRFAGRGQSRRVVAAPCIACGRPTPPHEIKERLCPRCRTD